MSSWTTTFASIVNAVEEGRGVYDNIRKFVAFLLSCNSGEVIAMFAASLIFVDPEYIPFLLPVHLLWMNLVTDGLPALALGVEPIEPNIMERPPNDPKEPPVTRRAALRVLAIGGAFAFSALLPSRWWACSIYRDPDECSTPRTVASAPWCSRSCSSLLLPPQTLTIESWDCSPTAR